jgi:hypothetical protein
MMFFMKKIFNLIFSEKTGSSGFFQKKNFGNPSNARKKVSEQSEAAKHTKLCLNISKKHKLKSKKQLLMA